MTCSMEDRVREIAEGLVGSCDLTPNEVFEVDGFAELLDSMCGCCNTCGWWFDSEELNDDYDCTDCVEEENE